MSSQPQRLNLTQIETFLSYGIGLDQNDARALLAECMRLRKVETALWDEIQAINTVNGETDRLRDALILCCDWLEQNRPLESNKKSDRAREAIQAARAALGVQG